MYIEYCNYNRQIEDFNQELTNIFKAIDKGLAGIATPIYLVKEIKEYMPSGLTIATPADFPCGYSSSKVRQHMVLDCLRSGATAIDYVPNQYLLKSKFIELKKEIVSIQKICTDYQATLRIFLDYHYSNNFITISRIFSDMGIEFAFPTIGYHHDDFTDNLLNSKLIENKTNIKAIFNGYVWRKDQIKTIEKNKIFGLRLYNLNLWCIL